MLQGLWFSGVSRGCEIRILVIYGSINDDLISLVVFPVYALWGHQEHVVLVCFWGMWDWNVGQRWVEQKKQIYISNKSEDKSSKKKSIACTEKDEKVL